MSIQPMSAAVVLSICCCSAATAGDWPQILGPERNGRAAADERLHAKWPASGPRVLWERSVGSGYAGLAVAGSAGVLFHREGNAETVERINLSTGAPVWRNAHSTSFRPQVGEGDGPLATPTIAEGRVVTFGAQGILSCHDLATGKLLWRRDAAKDFGVRDSYFGVGSSPLVENGLVVVNVGGFRTNSAVVAFSLEEGDTVWQSLDDQASYSSPIARTIDGQRRIVCVTRMNCLGIDPASGEVKFQFPFGQRGPTVNAANPLLLGEDQLFLTASYGIGALSASVKAGAADVDWRSDDLYSSQYCTPVPHDGVLFGIDGRQDGPPGDLKCVDPATRTTLWTQPGFGYGSLLFADGKLLIAGSEGELVLAAASRNRFEPLDRAQVLTGTVRALPALSNGKLYLRNEQTLKCLEVGPTSPADETP